MPAQAPLRLIKSCRLYLERDICQGHKLPPAVTRGLYVLYRKNKKQYEVTYIGVGGVKKKVVASGIGGRLRTHDTRDEKKTPWTHYSYFEVHDNVSREEILELESLLLTIFKHDKRIHLDNVQHGLNALKKLSKS